MSKEEQGLERIGFADRAGALRAEPPAASQAKPLIPCAGDYVIFRSSLGSLWGPCRVRDVTAKLVRFEGRGWPRQIGRDEVVAFGSNLAAVELLSQSLSGVEGEFTRRVRAADEERDRRIASARAARDKQTQQLVEGFASAMSAGTAETAKQAQGEARQRDPAKQGNAQ